MVALLDHYVIGQAHAKKILAVSVHNHYKRVMHDMERVNSGGGGGGSSSNRSSSDVLHSAGGHGQSKNSAGANTPFAGAVLPGDPEQYLQLNMLARTDPEAVSF